MNAKSRLLLVAVAGAAIGALGVDALRAQGAAAARGPAFYISEFQVTDPEGIRPYSARVASTFEPFGGRFIVRGGKVASLEGDPPHGRFVVIAFDSLEKAQAWYDSPAYRELRPIRHRSATSRVFILEGPPP